jgi:hypothetical protein
VLEAPPGDCIGLMDGAEGPEPKRKVFFQVPPNWDDLSEAEQDEILDRFIDEIRQAAGAAGDLIPRGGDED